MSNTQNIHISIITVNLNNDIGLVLTIQSILAQTYQLFEYIVIDGGSTDRSLDIIRENTHLITKWESSPDKGIYDAMNKGIKQARGQYLLFLNSGDLLTNPMILEKIAPKLNQFDLIYGNLIFNYQHFDYANIYPDNLSLRYFIKNSLPHPCLFIKKNVFEVVGLYNTTYKICSDWIHYLIAIFVYDCTYLHIDDFISRFDTTGISSAHKNKGIIKRERIIGWVQFFIIKFKNDFTKYLIK